MFMIFSCLIYKSEIYENLPVAHVLYKEACVFFLDQISLCAIRKNCSNFNWAMFQSSKPLIQ